MFDTCRQFLDCCIKSKQFCCNVHRFIDTVLTSVYDKNKKFLSQCDFRYRIVFWSYVQHLIYHLNVLNFTIFNAFWELQLHKLHVRDQCAEFAVVKGCYTLNMNFENLPDQWPRNLVNDLISTPDHGSVNWWLPLLLGNW